MAAALADADPETPTGVTGGFSTRLRRTVDISTAVTHLAHAISDAMRRFVTARDEYCTAPGCHVPAVDCDLDHATPWPQGQTTARNLRASCRGHHRCKTQYVVEASQDQARRLAARRGEPTELWPAPPRDPPF
jgi:hypothetical protein